MRRRVKKSVKPLMMRSEALMPAYERGANPEQLEAIRHETGPLRLLSVAGCGKTFVVCRRIVRLVRKVGIPGDRILAMTFSKKAAQEMSKRVNDLDVKDARVGTWHSLCLQMLKEDHTEWGSWEIDGSNDRPQRAKYVLKDVLGYKGMDWKGADLTAVNSFIGKCKANLFDPNSPEALALARPTFGHNAQRAVLAFSKYNDALAEKEILTYDDFLVFAVRHLESDENVRQQWANKWDAVICDEVQDNNRAQERLSVLLAKDHQNYMAVGDCFQAIFGFRGSSPDYLANFDKHWPTAKTIELPRNYRSGRKIIAAANCIVRNAKIAGLAATEMIAERDCDGAVQILCAEALDDEGTEIVKSIAASVEGGESQLADHTILYRTNAQSRAIEEALLKKRLPYIVVGGVSFYDRREVRDLLAYLRIAAKRGKLDDIKRSINTPFRFLGAKFVERVMDEVGEDVEMIRDWPMLVDKVADGERLQARQRSSARDWSSMINQMSKLIEASDLEDASPETKAEAAPSKLLETVVRTTRYIDWLNKEEGEESPENSAASNVREMIRVAERFTTADDLLDYIEETTKKARQQREDKQAGGNRVLLMTIHRCVAPDTLVETDVGMVRIADVPEHGVVGTVLGAKRYDSKITFEQRRMLRITTKSGYTIAVTEDHGMMSWTGEEYTRREASEIEVGDFLRLQLGPAIDPEVLVNLPTSPSTDVRARRYAFPKFLDENVAELLGLMVADGTVYKAGFRLRKRHRDVVERFRDLVLVSFGAGPNICEIPLQAGDGVYWSCDVNSTQIASWFLSVPGLAPRAKSVPPEILRSPLRVQAAFLRGLFEDGTVNIQGERLDHIALATCYERIARDVQTMLLRFGIISSRKMYGGQWRVSAFGVNAKRFGEKIGFVSTYKNNLLRAGKVGPEDNYVVPVRRENFKGGEGRWGDLQFCAQNAAYRGYVGRDTARRLGLLKEVEFHHERVAAIESYEGPAMCLSVPEHGRFLQNGFDGCNSKGLEWPNVYVVGMNEMILPHHKGDVEEERRLAYVAATRARDVLTMSYVRRIATRAGIKDVEPSRFLVEAKTSLEPPPPPPTPTVSSQPDTDDIFGLNSGVVDPMTDYVIDAMLSRIEVKHETGDERSEFHGVEGMELDEEEESDQDE